jgi:hypothetical protein
MLCSLPAPLHKQEPFAHLPTLPIFYKTLPIRLQSIHLLINLDHRLHIPILASLLSFNGS